MTSPMTSEPTSSEAPMTEMDELAARAAAVLQRTQDGIGTLPARDSVKLRPRDWHACEDLLREIARRPSLSPAGVTDTEARAFAVAYAKACNHRYDMGAIRAGLEAAAKVRSPADAKGDA